MSGKTITSRLVVSLLDGVSAPAAKAGQALKRLQASANFTTAPIIRSAQRLGGAVTGLQNSLHGPGGIMAAFAAVDQTHNFVKFTEHMNRVRAATMASASEMRALQDEIFKVSKQHGKVYDEVAEGALQLVKSGKDIHETMGALDATVGASVAIEKSVGHTAETLTDIVYGMGLRVTNQKEAMDIFGYVADVATAASFKFNQTYDELSRSLAKGAPIARIAGLSLIKVAALMGVSGDEGFKGAKGGAAFAASTLRMLSPTKKARAELAAAGIDLSKFMKKAKDVQLGGQTLADALNEGEGIDADALVPRINAILKDPRFKDSATLLGKELQRAVAEGLNMDANSPNIGEVREAVDRFLRVAMSKVDIEGVYHELAAKNADSNTALMKELFGIHHSPAEMAIINAFRTDLYDKQLKLLEEQAPGAVKRHETANLEGLSGSLLKLTSAWKLFGAALFTTGGVAESLTNTFTGIANALHSLSSASPAVLKFIGTAATALAASAALGFAFEILKIATAGLRLAFVALTGPIGLVVAGLGAIAYFNWEGIKTRASTFADGFSKGFWDNLKVPDETVRSWERFKAAFDGVSGLKLDFSGWHEFGKEIGGISAILVSDLIWALGQVLELFNKSVAAANALGTAIRGIQMPSLFGGGAAAPAGGGVAGARAAGGPVIGGRPYLIGEAGPELFVPRSSGGIVPNHKLGAGGGSVTINAPITISSSTNVEDLKRTLERHLERWASEAFRTVQADTGLRWS